MEERGEGEGLHLRRSVQQARFQIRGEETKGGGRGVCVKHYGKISCLTNITNIL